MCSLRRKPLRVSPAQTGLPAQALRHSGTPPVQLERLSITHKETAMAAMNGTIKRLVSEKGFGFILASDGNEYFFHNSACNQVRFDELQEGQSVSFERGQGPKGPRGENVRLS
jgi:CspA family cold shock protein